MQINHSLANRPCDTPRAPWTLSAFFALAILGLSSLPVRGQTLTGNDLYDDCTSSEPVKMGFCVGHITGLVQGMPFGASLILFSLGADSASQVNKTYEGISGYCLVEDAENGQMVDIVRNYLIDNPEKRHLSARWIVYEALKGAFPPPDGCKQ